MLGDIPVDMAHYYILCIHYSRVSESFSAVQALIKSSDQLKGAAKELATKRTRISFFTSNTLLVEE